MSWSDWYPLIGVAVGAGITFGTTVWLDSRRFRREDSTYWRKERLETYTAFAVATKRYMALLYRLAASRHLDDQAQPLTLEHAAVPLAEAFHDRDAAFERVRMVAGEQIEDSARQWVQHVHAMRELVVAEGLSREEWGEAVRRANERRGEFHRAIRRELHG